MTHEPFVYNLLGKWSTKMTLWWLIFVNLTIQRQYKKYKIQVNQQYIQLLYIRRMSYLWLILYIREIIEVKKTWNSALRSWVFLTFCVFCLLFLTMKSCLRKLLHKTLHYNIRNNMFCLYAIVFKSLSINFDSI